MVITGNELEFEENSITKWGALLEKCPPLLFKEVKLRDEVNLKSVYTLDIVHISHLQLLCLIDNEVIQYQRFYERCND